MAVIKVKVLGPGGDDTKKLLEAARAAVAELDDHVELECVTNLSEIQEHVMLTPGLVIDGRIAHQGEPLPEADKIKALILKVMAGE